MTLLRALIAVRTVRLPAGALGFALRLAPALALCLALGLATAPAAHAVPVARLDNEAGVARLSQAERALDDGAYTVVALPDELETPAGAPYIEAAYRFDVDVRGAPTGRALYLSGVRGHVRLQLNGRTLLDTLTDEPGTAPRGINLLRLVDLPPHLVQAGLNRIDITLRGPRGISLSRIHVGAQQALSRARDGKAIWLVYAPAVVAALMVCLGLSVLLIWLRRPMESMYAYFGVAAVVWGLHTAWNVSPNALLGPRHFSVWWDTMYYFLVAVLTVFCVRFAGYPMRRARWLLGSTLLVPVILYATQGMPIHGPMHEVVRLVMVFIAFTGLVAVARVAWIHRSVDNALLVFAALVATAFGLRDWVVFRVAQDNLPVQLTPFAGLPFVALVTWILIDRFVRATESLEVLNRDLEKRVQTKSAELVSALDHMRAARDWADSANRAKSSFLAAASHDLRQPIHALGLYMSALRRRPLDAQVRDIVARMDGSVAALDSLFNALLDISRMDAGTVVPQPRPLDLAQLLHRLADEMAGEAAMRGLRFGARIGAWPGPVTARADPVLLERVLRNLIANALKYTRSGGVLITCRARRGPPRRWLVEVWDSGPGIGEGERERVFDEFYQGGNPERDRRSGLGLGLAIVRRLARLMKLPLALHTRVGHGTRFSIDIPASDERVAGEDPREAAGSLDGLMVAVIEDDVEVRDAMLTLLRSWGCVVLAGADGDEVLQQAAAQQASPRAVVADLRLAGGRDGLDAVAALRARFGAALPAIVVSGDSAPERVRLMQDSGIPWLSKPVPAARLRSWLLAMARVPVEEEAVR